METKDMPHGILGFMFAQALVKGEYDKAHAMLSAELKLEYPPTALKQNYEDMIDYAQPSRQPDVEVLDNSLIPDAPRPMDEEGWVYVSIFGDGWSEAVIVTVKPFGHVYLITELIWGRP
jgi:hypothetical protein